MIDSTGLGAVVGECAAGAAELVVEGDGCGECEEALQDALSQAGEGSGAVTLEGEGALAAPEDALDALTDGREVWAFAGLVLAAGSEDPRVHVADGLGERPSGVALVADQGLPALAAGARQEPQGDLALITVASPKRDEREVALELLARTRRQGRETLIGDKGYAGRAFAQAVSDMDARILRPRRKDEPGKGPHLAPIRQRIESIFWSCKGTLTLERHGARTLPGLRERILQRLLTLAAAITLNHQLGRPSRALADYCA